jgi:hypothetical protein
MIFGGAICAGAMLRAIVAPIVSEITDRIIVTKLWMHAGDQAIAKFFTNRWECRKQHSRHLEPAGPAFASGHRASSRAM